MWWLYICLFEKNVCYCKVISISILTALCIPLLPIWINISIMVCWRIIPQVLFIIIVINKSGIIFYRSTCSNCNCTCISISWQFLYLQATSLRSRVYFFLFYVSYSYLVEWSIDVIIMLIRLQEMRYTIFKAPIETYLHLGVPIWIAHYSFRKEMLMSCRTHSCWSLKKNNVDKVKYRP